MAPNADIWISALKMFADSRYWKIAPICRYCRYKYRHALTLKLYSVKSKLRDRQKAMHIGSLCSLHRTWYPFWDQSWVAQHFFLPFSFKRWNEKGGNEAVLHILYLEISSYSYAGANNAKDFHRNHLMPSWTLRTKLRSPSIKSTFFFNMANLEQLKFA